MAQDRVDDTARSAWALPNWFVRLGQAGWSLVGIVLAAAVLFGLIGATSEIVAPVVLAVFLAVVCAPAVDRLERRGLPRALGATAVLLGLVGLVVGALWTVGATLVDQAGQLADDVDRAIARIREQIEGTPLDTVVIDRIKSGTAEVGDVLLGGAGAAVINIFDSAFGLVAGSILGAVVLYYLLKDLHVIAAHAAGDGEPTERRRLALSISRRAVENVRQYMGGRTVLALINGVTIAFAALVLDVPAVFAIAFVNVVGSYIPYIGGFVGGAFAVLLALGDEGWIVALIMLTITLVVNLALENLLEPRLIGDSLHLHPLLILLATSVGGIYAGIIGLMLAAPILAILIDAERQLRRAGFFDQ